MTKLDDHKEGMSDGAYKEMAEAIKRVREEEEEPLFEVAYTATTVTAVCMDFDDEYLNHLLFTHTQHTKIMRISGQYTAASFEKGLLSRPGASPTAFLSRLSNLATSSSTAHPARLTLTASRAVPSAIR